MAKGQRLKNEIHANCVSCNSKRLVAYWDEELESYIYLCDEIVPICVECASTSSSSQTREVEASSLALA